MRKELILNVINKTIGNNSKGLLILNAPTGYGKTYQVLKYIRENYKTKKIFFIANQEKLLPKLEDLVETLNNNDKQKLTENTLYLKSIINTYKESFLSINIDKQFKKPESIDAINSIKGIIKSLKSKDLDSDINQLLIERFYEEEKKLRKLIKKHIEENTTIPDWITKLYPSVNLDKYKVIFMTTKKFFLPIDPLTKKSYYLFEKEFDNSVLFIDEVDSTKNEILDIIIDYKNNDKIELFRLFRNINSAIIDESIIKDFPVDEDGYISYAQEYLQHIKEYFVEKHAYIKQNSTKDYDDKSALEYAFKSMNFNENHNFVFNDGYNITILGKRQKKKLQYEFNKKKNRNEIIVSTDNKINNLEVVFNAVLDSISFFVNQTAKLVLEYRKNYERINGKEIDVSYVYSSIIDRMNLGEENKEYLLSSIHEYMARGKSKLNEKDEFFNMNYRLKKNDFYLRGFSYLEVVDNIEHHLESKLYTYKYNKTPEYYLLLLSNNYHVVGLSATAMINSAITNYDLDYLKFILNNKYREFTNEEINEINEDYHDLKKEVYQNTAFDIRLIDNVEKERCPDNPMRYLEIILGNESLYFQHVHEIKNNNMEKHYYEETANLYQVVDNFMNNNSVHSFIYFSNSNLNNWGTYKDLIVKTIQDKYYDSIKFVILDANYYTKNVLQQTLAVHDKVFIVTAYNTVGTGVNLQYSLELEMNNIKKDIDGVYLSKPTNVMPNLMQSIISRREIAKYIYVVEYSKVKDSISFNDYLKSINYAFLRYLGFEKELPFGYQTNDEIGLGIVKIIIQAIGRISRTFCARNHILIYTTNDVSDYLSQYSTEINLIPTIMEVQKLMNFVNTRNTKTNTLKLLNNAADINTNAKKYIGSLIKPWNWTKEKIIKWNSLREFVLMNPTIGCNNNDYVKDMYFHFSSPTNQYSTDNIYKVKKISNDKCVYRTSVSSHAAHLDWAMNFDYIKKEFILKNYAIEFKQNNFVMSPILFKSIYKGAIGEKVGESILNHFKIEVNHIVDENLFELFDFHYKKSIFFDFKNWSKDFKIEEYKEIAKIKRKNKNTKGIYIYVVNVFYEGYKKTNKYITDNVEIITIPWLINSNTETNKDAIEKIMEKVNIWK